MSPSLRREIERYVAGSPDPVRALVDVARAAGDAALETSRRHPFGPTKRALIAGHVRLRAAADFAESVTCSATAGTRA